MRRVLALLVLLCLPAAARATWAMVSLEELVQESDIIVVGTLRDVKEHSDDARDYGEGRIDVREVIWGDVSPGDALTLRWENASAVVCPRVEHKQNAGEEGIWLLTRGGDAFNANYPGRFVELSRRRKIEAALRDSPVVLRAERYRVKPGEPMRFSVVYRNASNAPRAFPGLASGGGGLRVSQGSRLAVRVTFGGEGVDGAARLAGRVVRDAAVAPVTLPPRGERRVELDLRGMLAAEPEEKYSYDVTFSFGGLPPTNELGFYVGEPLSLRPAAPPHEPTLEPASVLAVRFERPGSTGRAPLARAALAALVALLLFPFFYRLRSALACRFPE